MEVVNVLFLITGLNDGGAEMQIYQLIKKLIKYGHYNPIVVSLLEPGQIGTRLKEENVKVYSLQMERGKTDIHAIWKLHRIIREENICLIHSHLFHANLLARVVKILHPEIKIITTVHSINIGSRSRERILQWTNFLSDTNTIISEAARKHFIKNRAFSETTLRLIPNGVDTARFDKDINLRLETRHNLQIDDRFAFLAVGRFEEAKNYPNLLKALSVVVKTHNNVQLLLAGTGPLLKETVEMAEALNLSGHIRFLGYQKDIAALMNASDTYVMSSSWEGMPLVLLEASAVGLPIICTDVGGNREVVIDGETGFIVKPESHLSLAAKMGQLMEMPEQERMVMGEKARAYIEATYDINRIADNWQKLYEEVLI